MLTNETLTIIEQRRSVRSFKNVQLEEEKLKLILNAGQCAPYAEEGSRHFTVIQNKEKRTADSGWIQTLHFHCAWL